MRKQIAKNWTATDKRGASWYLGVYPYEAAECDHGEGISHTLQEAIKCGMLKAVRSERGHSQEAVARLIGVTTTTVARWERGEISPTGLSEKALEGYLVGSTGSCSGNPKGSSDN